MAESIPLIQMREDQSQVGLDWVVLEGGIELKLVRPFA